MRQPSAEELRCLQTVARIAESIVGGVSHEASELDEFCDDKSTLSVPDIFNRCHDLGWLHSAHDNRNDTSYVWLTESGRTALTKEGMNP